MLPLIAAGLCWIESTWYFSTFLLVIHPILFPGNLSYYQQLCRTVDVTLVFPPPWILAQYENANLVLPIYNNALMVVLLIAPRLSLNALCCNLSSFPIWHFAAVSYTMHPHPKVALIKALYIAIAMPRCLLPSQIQPHTSLNSAPSCILCQWFQYDSSMCVSY